MGVNKHGDGRLIILKIIETMSLVRKRRAAASVLLMLTFSEEEESVRVLRGKTRKWIKRREEKGYFNNINCRRVACRGHRELPGNDEEMIMRHFRTF